MGESEQNLEDLLCRIAAGDRDAFQQFYGATAGVLRAVIRNIVRDNQIASDLTQEAYIAIWRKADTYDSSKGGAYAWLMAIGRNKARDHLRSAGRKPETTELTEDLAENLETFGASPETSAVNANLKITAAAEIAKLPLNMRRALILHYFDDLDHAEISRLLNAPVNTVKSWIRRGTERLRKKDVWGE